MKKNPLEKLLARVDEEDDDKREGNEMKHEKVERRAFARVKSMAKKMGSKCS